MPIRMRRQVPDLAQLRPLMRFQRPELDARKRRLAKALTIGDLRKIAQRRTPKGAFDYTDGAAEDEVSLHRARQAYADVEFHPRVLRDVSTADSGWDVLGKRVEQPFGIAPTGFTRMMQAEGERAGATAAAAAGIPFTLSTMGTTSIEDVAATAPSGRHWFQLYLWNDREASLDLVRRAEAAGYDTLMITVDTPVAGNRMRDVRNGFTVPPSLNLGSVFDAARRPAWWIDFLTTEPLSFASIGSGPAAVIEQINTMFDPSITDEVVREVRAAWPGKLVIKGVQSVADACDAVDLGADAVLLSNHGGRQLDRAPVPFYLLPEVVREVGRDLEVHVDTGITNGADVVAALAHGARFTLVGRAYLYGLMAGGREGVSRMIEIMSSQIRRTMQLLGVASLDELEPSHVTQLQRLHPRTR